jgi:hypothetical protein
MENKIAVFIPHQGFTDIFNCLAHIDYYISLDKYSTLCCIIREDAKDIVNFYCRNKSNNKTNVICIYFSLSYLDHIVHSGNFDVYQHYKSVLQISDYDSLFLGIPDKHCTNHYKNKFFSINDTNWCKRFYTVYGIDYDVRYKFFNVCRDENLENSEYLKFITKNGNNYSLSHSVDKSKITSTSDNIIDLTNTSTIFFDYIKILENAKELHLIDSVWAILVYLLNCKYGLFNNHKVVIYCRIGEGHKFFFTDSFNFPNFSFVYNFHGLST